MDNPALFFIFLILRWVVYWNEFKALHIEYDMPVYFADFVKEIVRYMHLNWEAELLQLTFVGAALGFLLYVGPILIKDAGKEWNEYFNE